MKILFTVSTYYPLKDGVSKVTQYLAEGLASKGHQVKVITSNAGLDVNFEIYNSVEIKRVNMHTKFGFYYGDIKSYKRLIDEETKLCDVMINVCTQNAFTDVILNRINNYKCKKILYMHGMFDFKFHKSNFSSFASIINKLWKEIRWFIYYKLNGKHFKKYEIVTQLHEKDYSCEYFKKHYNINSVIIENAADNEFFIKKVNKNFNKPFNKYLLYVANYDDRKNQLLAIKEFLKSNISSDIGLVLIGSKKNKYYDMLTNKIINLRKKYCLNENEKPIKMLYNVDRSLISSYVSNAYLYLMTSKWEAYPISIVESMACGVPYICTDVGIVRYFVGGIISRPDDINYWIKKIIENDEIRNDLSIICSKYAKEHFKIKSKLDLIDNLLID